MAKQAEKIPGCCKPKSRKGFIGILYGLIPHAGCIAFVLASALGLTFAASIFRPLLASSMLFYAMIGMSLVFASISAFFYMKKDISTQNIKNHKGYLGILFGSTIAVSMLLYFLIFPAVAGAAFSGGATADSDSSIVNINVAIPCEGHVPLIIEEISRLNGVKNVKYSGNFNFAVDYDSSQTSKQDILNLSIFKEYRAKIIMPTK